MTRQKTLLTNPGITGAIDDRIRRSLMARKDQKCAEGITLFDTLAVFNVQYGNAWLKRYNKDSNKYICTCKCGAVMALSADEVVGKVISGTGCRNRRGCSVETVHQKVVHDFYMHLKFQHWLLLTCSPRKVCSWWGGSADDAFIMVPPSVGEDRFAENIYHADLKVTSENYWVSRKNPSLPFMSSNIEFARLPDKAVQGTIGKLEVWKGNKPTGFTVSRFLAATHIDIWRLLYEAFATGSFVPKRIIIPDRGE